MVSADGSVVRRSCNFPRSRRVQQTSDTQLHRVAGPVRDCTPVTTLAWCPPTRQPLSIRSRDSVAARLTGAETRSHRSAHWCRTGWGRGHAATERTEPAVGGDVAGPAGCRAACGQSEAEATRPRPYRRGSGAVPCCPRPAPPATCLHLPLDISAVVSGHRRGREPGGARVPPALSS